MTPSTLDRKRLFRMALAANGESAERFSLERGIYASHLASHLNGRPNERIAPLVDQYIAETFRTYRIRVPKSA
jgi:hypothetical protein